MKYNYSTVTSTGIDLGCADYLTAEEISRCEFGGWYSKGTLVLLLREVRGDTQKIQIGVGPSPWMVVDIYTGKGLTTLRLCIPLALRGEVP